MDEFGRIDAADNQKEALARGLGEYYQASDQRIYDAVEQTKGLDEPTRAKLEELTYVGD